GVEVKVEGAKVEVKGPKGTLSHEVPPEIQVEVSDGQIWVRRRDDSRRAKSLHGLNRTLIANMVEGVTKGFEKRLEIVGIGYRAALEGKALKLTLGFSHPVIYPIPEGVEIVVDNPTSIVVRGIDKQRVGQVAAEIRALKKPEPYKGKGIRYAGEEVRRKAGKGRAA
ncbi:MAG TPA: 50S ribosomal protein L6, partial [Deltaproteobacteria bacterium]|nr:50S ribosomal protein L6 [Deltaproteobacteria bacterium]